MQFITAHADRVTVDGLRWGVEPIRAVLASQGIPIAASTYYAARAAARVGPMSAALREAELIDHIRRVHAAHFGVYGARKVWLSSNREGVPVARCTVERLMGQLGLVGALRGKVKRTTIAGPAADRPGDLVRRRFDPAAPNRLWVADFTYVSTWSGWVYVAFVIDAYSRRILGWRCSTAMTTPLVLDAVEQAIWTRAQAGVSDLAGLVHHSDRGSQYGALAMTDRLLSAGIDPSVGATGSSYDNALAETINGLYKTELIKRRGPWKTLEQVEIATLEWVDWFNHRRLNSYCDDMPPAELEAAYYRHHQTRPPAEVSTV